ncbi:TonB-dependent receptor plug domain-containing protein [Bergeyella sp. RCAD1439]|uniref:TonB-dependent receptor plug domain-containing protein n=1 Tax=Bergeyella anatis TaxID=3113737 RepID=UPI002E19CE1B|nr:TonB-dependent receptor [Bergeyella sp. RCAD1439]
MIVSFRKLFCFPGLLAFFYLVNGQEVKDSISTKEIQEVLIKAQRKKQFSDHANYTFDKEALEKARHSKDLLTTLPELQLDPISNTVSSIKGGKILFLINGIEASDNQIKSIAPTNVVRVEYFDIPSARYSQRADTVVNIITRNPEVGYSYGADVTSALSTGFVNGSAYAGYTKGKNDFGLEYSISLRDYNNRQYSKIYDYNLNGIHYRSDLHGRDHFGYTDQNISVRYAQVDAEKYTFQAKFSINPMSYFSKGNAESIFQQGNLSQNDVSISNSNQSYTNPTLDLYYSKNFGKKDELSLNLIGSHYTTNSSQFDHEWNTANNVAVFNNDMNLKAKQTGIVGEIAHTHQFEKGKLSLGYRISNTAISNDLVNLLGTSHYNVNYLEQYLYTEYLGKWDKLGFRFGMGVMNIHNKSAGTTRDDWTPTPKLVLSYDLPKNKTIRLTSDYTSQSPWAEALSRNIIQIVPNIYRSGNPYLKPKHIFKNNLSYSFNDKYLDVNTTAFYNYLKKDIAQIYTYDINLNGFLLRNVNANYTRQVGIQLSGSIKPFGSNILVAKMVFVPTIESLVFYSGEKINNNYIGNFFNISTQYKSFYAQYQFNIPYYTVDGAFLSTNENASHFFAQYKFKEWIFKTGMYWIGMPSEYRIKSLSESVVDYTVHTKIINNKNMFVLGVSYDFSTGKKNELNKTLNNNVTPASTF